MTSCVIVPTYQRSDLLYVCLEAIRAAEPNIELHVFPDHGTSEVEVCEKFGAIEHKTIDHRYLGNSFNMLEALKWAYQSLSRYDPVYVIEDDAIVDPTFFQWCREALASPWGQDAFAACGWRYSPDAIIGEGPDILIRWYLSVCAAIPRRSLYSIVQHARPEYYGDMQGYLDRAYPNSWRRKSMHYEQDGLILRVCESESKRCLWPRRPRAIHAGWRGYHQTQGKELPGTLAERIEILKLVIKEPQLLNKMMAGGKLPEITECCECKKPLITDIKKVRAICRDCFHRAHPHHPVATNSHYYLSDRS